MLGGLVALLTVAAAALLADVLATVFFAVTVAYLLTPLRRRLTARGLSPWTASVAATGAAFLGVVAVTLPLFAVVFLRLDALLAVLARLPREYTLDLFGMAYTLTLAEALAAAQSYLRAVGSVAVAAVSTLLVKVTLFAFLVFSLLHHRRELGRAMLAVVPESYRDVAAAFDRRTRETLFAIYVLQAATALGTFALAVPVFVALGYRVPFTLAVVAALLQFIPIVGPSLLLAALAAYHAALGDVALAATTLAVGGVVIAWLPDVLIRPRLARETAGLPGGLYFVGFVGGLLSMGAVGVIAGPLVVALVAEGTELLAAELDGSGRVADAAADAPDETPPLGGTDAASGLPDAESDGFDTFDGADALDDDAFDADPEA